MNIIHVLWYPWYTQVLVCNLTICSTYNSPELLPTLSSLHSRIHDSTYLSWRDEEGREGANHLQSRVPEGKEDQHLWPSQALVAGLPGREIERNTGLGTVVYVCGLQSALFSGEKRGCGEFWCAWLTRYGDHPWRLAVIYGCS